MATNHKFIKDKQNFGWKIKIIFFEKIKLSRGAARNGLYVPQILGQFGITEAD